MTRRVVPAGILTVRRSMAADAVEKGQAMKTKTTISRAEGFKAGSWIETNWARLATLTRDECVRELGEHLGKPLNEDHLRRLLSDMGREWPGRTAKRKSIGKGGVAQRSRFLARQIVLLERQVRRLYTTMAELGLARDPKLDLNLELLVQIGNITPVGEHEKNGRANQPVLPLE